MTRELKLALVVGFALVLIVTVLISDHLSKARRSDLDSRLAERPSLVPPAPADAGSPPVEPVRGVESPYAGADAARLTPPPVELVQRTTTGGPEVVARGSFDEVVGNLSQRIRNGEVAIPPAVVPAPAPGAGQSAGRGVAPGLPEGMFTPVGPTGPQGQPAPSLPAILTTPVVDKEYVTAEGDSAFKIAKQHYGKGDLWKKLAAYNPGRFGPGGELRTGVRIKLPPIETLTGKPAPAAPTTPAASAKAATTPPSLKPEPAPAAKHAGPRTYTVKKGDTLHQIALRELKSASRLQELIDLNESVIEDPDNLVIGTVIRLPGV